MKVSETDGRYRDPAFGLYSVGLPADPTGHADLDAVERVARSAQIRALENGMSPQDDPRYVRAEQRVAVLRRKYGLD